MSYAKFGEDNSDVYVYSNSIELFCCGCTLNNHSLFISASWPEMVEHLKEHVKKGDVVPESTFQRLAHEIDGKTVARYWFILRDGQFYRSTLEECVGTHQIFTTMGISEENALKNIKLKYGEHGEIEVDEDEYEKNRTL